MPSARQKHIIIGLLVCLNLGLCLCGDPHQQGDDLIVRQLNNVKSDLSRTAWECFDAAVEKRAVFNRGRGSVTAGLIIATVIQRVGAIMNVQSTGGTVDTGVIADNVGAALVRSSFISPRIFSLMEPEPSCAFGSQFNPSRFTSELENSGCKSDEYQGYQETATNIA